MESRPCIACGETKNNGCGLTKEDPVISLIMRTFNFAYGLHKKDFRVCLPCVIKLEKKLKIAILEGIQDIKNVNKESRIRRYKEDVMQSVIRCYRHTIKGKQVYQASDIKYTPELAAIELINENEQYWGDLSEFGATVSAIFKTLDTNKTYRVMYFNNKGSISFKTDEDNFVECVEVFPEKENITVYKKFL